MEHTCVVCKKMFEHKSMVPFEPRNYITHELVNYVVYVCGECSTKEFSEIAQIEYEIHVIKRKLRELEKESVKRTKELTGCEFKYAKIRPHKYPDAHI